MMFFSIGNPVCFAMKQKTQGLKNIIVYNIYYHHTCESANAMTEITVIETESLLANVDTLSTEELELIFGQISENYPNIDKSYFDSLRDLVIEEATHTNASTKPSLEELILRSIPMHARVALVIRQIPQQRIYQPLVRTTTKKQDLPFSITIKTNTRVWCIDAGSGLGYVAAPNTPIEVVGVIVADTIRNITNNCVSSVWEFYPRETANINDKYLLSNGSYAIERFTPSLSPWFAARPQAIDCGSSPPTPPRVLEWLTHNGANNPHIHVCMFDKNRASTLDRLFDFIAINATYMRGKPALEYAAYTISSHARKIIGRPRISKMEPPITISPTVSHIDLSKTKVLITRIEPILGIRVSDVFSDNLLSDLYSAGIARLWFAALQKGVDSDEVKSIISTYITHETRIGMLALTQKRKLNDIYEISEILVATEEKLGRPRYLELKRTIDPNLSSKDVRALLSKSEQKIVDLEIARKENYHKAITTNTCPHVGISRKWRRAVDDRIGKQLLKDLEAFFANSKAVAKANINPQSRVSASGGRDNVGSSRIVKPSIDTTSMITCNNCGYDIMCPHIHELKNLQYSRTNFKLIRASMEKYIDAIPLQGSFYCSICGEIIISKEEMESDEIPREERVDMGDKLYQMLNAEFRLVNSYLTFSAAVNVGAWIRSGVNACYVFMFEIEKAMLRIKSQSEEEIQNKLKLYSTITTFAWIVHFIESNDYNSYVAFKRMKPSNKITDYLTYAMKKIMDMRNVVISAVPGANTTFVKNKLLERYRDFKRIGPNVLQLSDIDANTFMILHHDPVYWWYNFIFSVAKQSQIAWEIPTIMGKSLEKLKDGELYGHVVIPTAEITKWKSGDSTTANKWVSNRDSVVGAASVFEKGVPANIAAAFELFRRSQSQKQWREYLYVGTSFNPAFNKYYAEGQALLEREAILYSFKKATTIRSRNLGATNPHLRFKLGAPLLGRKYDENGIPHKWDIFVGSNSANTPAVYSRAELATSIMRNAQVTVVDIKCSVCGVLKSETAKLSNTKIRTALDRIAHTRNFFKFFENRCPVGGIHEYENDNQCGKCVWDRSTYPAFATSGLPSKSAVVFMDKYLSNYTTEVKSMDTLEELPPPPRIPQIDEKFASGFKPQFSILLDVSNKFKVNINVLTTLGDTLLRNWDDILAGKITTSTPTERWDWRIGVVDNYINLLNIDYNQLRHYANINSPSIEHRMMIEKSKISRFELNKLPEMLPNIFANHHNKLRSLRFSNKPKLALDFATETLCGMLIMIYRDNNTTTKKLREDYIEYFISLIVRNEKVLTEYKKFSWDVYTKRGDKIYSDDTTDSNTSIADINVDMANIDLDELNDEERAEITDTSSLFDTSAYDMEDSVYDDDEDDGMFNAVGYGLD